MKRKTIYCTIFALLFAVSLAAGAFAQTVDFQYRLGGSSRYGLIDDDGLSYVCCTVSQAAGFLFLIFPI